MTTPALPEALPPRPSGFSAARTGQAETEPAGTADRNRNFTAKVAELRACFPARPLESSWPQTEQSMEQILKRLEDPLVRADKAGTRQEHYRGVAKLLEWLASTGDGSWQERWIASGAEELNGQEWLRLPVEWIGNQRTDSSIDPSDLSTGLMLAICMDVIRPGLAWTLTRRHTHFRAAMARIRDPQGFARLRQIVAEDPAISPRLGRTSILRIACITACKGGAVNDITVGDCVELMDTMRIVHSDGGRARSLFYHLLRTAGVFGEDAPATLRAFTTARGQLSVEEMVDRYQLACKPIRDLFVDYLRERQPSMDYNTLRQTAGILVGSFWADLERHHPGIDSLSLSPQVATGWKQRIQTRVRTTRNANGERVEVRVPRVNATDVMYEVRAFYLDLAEWATQEPARWGSWAAPSPVSERELSRKKQDRHRKARMDARTRELLPLLPALVHAVNERRKNNAERLEAARNASPGAQFTVAGETLIKPVTPWNPGGKQWCKDPATGRRRDLGYEESDAFWAWAIIEVLRHTGIRIEELCELSHHSITQYRLPSTGELIPLLQIAPSKMDTERLVLVSPELADVLSAVVSRVRGSTGTIPVIAAYDPHEKLWNPPMPLLFQRPMQGENRPFRSEGIRDMLRRALIASGLPEAQGRALDLTPHDFRRLFITDTVMNGLPPHIAQVICGHRDINTTMGYKAIYPAETIESHRAFIARRRALRPSEEYRTPTEAEWDAFLSHFEKRKLSIGTCARAFGTPCIHEHACVRCALLRPDPTQRPRLAEIRDNLIDRIAEAEREGWRGEIEGLQVSLAGAHEKLAQIDRRTSTTLDIGMPSFARVAARTSTAAPQHSAGGSHE